MVESVSQPRSHPRMYNVPRLERNPLVASVSPKVVVWFFTQVLIPKLKKGELKIMYDSDGNQAGLVSTKDWDRYISEVNQVLIEGYKNGTVRSLQGGMPLLRHSNKSMSVRIEFERSPLRRV